LKDPARSPRL